MPITSYNYQLQLLIMYMYIVPTLLYSDVISYTVSRQLKMLISLSLLYRKIKRLFGCKDALWGGGGVKSEDSYSIFQVKGLNNLTRGW